MSSIKKKLIVDRTKVMPMHKLLQKFYGAKYITSLDLSIAFLQVSLKQWTAFQFESNGYQFTTVTYGFKNSLAAFIRALGKVLGECNLNNILVLYLDDLIIDSSTFTEYLHHIDLVLDKLTSAGFRVKFKWEEVK